jgi:predicted Na+-dependent transporter
MTILSGTLVMIARHGRLALVAGLLAGLTLPDLAALIRPWLPHLVALLLFLTAFRIGLRQAAGSLAEARSGLMLVAVFQMVMPLAALVIFWALGLMATPFAIAVMLMLTAPGVSGAAAFTALLGRDPAPALRLLITGMAVFPLTVMPILWATPALGNMADVLAASGRLLAVIVIASALGFALRRLIPAPDLRQIDGLNAIALFVIVIGLMAAVGPALRSDPVLVLKWLAGVCAVNFGLQIACYMILRGRSAVDPTGPSIIAGNRNVALFLLALPAATTDPLLIFIGVYQVPMFLTPIAMRWLYAPRPDPKAAH